MAEITTVNFREYLTNLTVRVNVKVFEHDSNSNNTIFLCKYIQQEE